MKNIHVLPTDKRSILSDCVNYKHVYITSDEQIEDVRPHKGKWHLEQGQILNKFPTYLTDLSECKLVIMTTDQDLIADGIQAIDHEFLEWFVENPSCEEVEVELQIKSVQLPQKQLSKNSYDLSFRWIDVTYYKIIIPQEEPKQETLEEAAKKYRLSTVNKMGIEEVAFITGAKSEAARDYWFEQFKKNGGDE